MRGLLRCAVFAGLVAAGVGSTGCGDDAPTPDPDAAVGGGGLVVTWASDPNVWPGDLGDGLTLERATFALDNLRVVGDAGPGDPRTTAGSRELLWDDEIQPAALGFPDAPSGLYSQLSILIDGHVAGPSIELRGHVRVNDTDYEYRLTDDDPFSVTLPINKTLQPPAITTLVLLVDFEHVLDAIDFAQLSIENGRLELDNGDPQFATFRAKLVEAFDVN